MSSIINQFTSSTARKVLMSLTGLFLCTFLIAHMSGNFLLFNSDGGVAFNEYAKFMTSFPLIRILSIVTFISIILHAVQGIMLWNKNRKARSSKYAGGSKNKGSSWASRNMALLGTVILVFLIIHLKSFWYETHFGELPIALDSNGEKIKDLYTIVFKAFSDPLYVGFYLLSLAALAFHLLHGFESGFQTLGLSQGRYKTIFKWIGYAFAIFVPLGFASQPLFVLFKHLAGS